MPKKQSHRNETTNTTTFQCQHGPAECRENMLQSCALHTLIGRPDDQMLYVACQMNKTVDHSGEECAKRLGISWPDVQQCLTGENGLGNRLQLEAEQHTHRVRVPYPEFVPTVTLDDVSGSTRLQIFYDYRLYFFNTDLLQIHCEASH